MNDTNQAFFCNCNTSEHQFVVQFDTEWKEFYFDIHLSPLTFWGRVRAGLRYILGLKNHWGCFDGMILDVNKATQLADLLNNFIHQCEATSKEA